MTQTCLDSVEYLSLNWHQILLKSVVHIIFLSSRSDMRVVLIVLACCVAFVTCYQGASLLSFPFVSSEEFMQLLSFDSLSSLVSSFVKAPSQWLTKLIPYGLQLSLFVVSALALWLLVKVANLLFKPLNVVRHLGDVGYVETREQKGRNAAKISRRTRKIGNLPPVYPNGWFHLCFSDEVPAKQAKYVQQLGEHFVVFREASGRVHVLDAYCPHMGANLGVGGQVVGDCIECPFHGWRFRGSDGSCAAIPYASDPTKVPDKAKLRSWTSLERNDIIYLWYHAEGEEPSWEPEEIPEIRDGKWTSRGQTIHYVSCHIEEVPENGADFAHFTHLHSPMMAAGTDIRTIFSPKWKLARHAWKANWRQLDPPNQHIGELTLNHTISFHKWTMPGSSIDVLVHQIGPGLVSLFFDTVFGRMALLLTLTPVEPMLQRMVHRVYCRPRVPNFFAKFLLYGESIQVDRDLMIWNNKMWIDKPLFVKEDCALTKHRRWFSQFYSEHSPRMKDIISRGEGLEW